MGRRAKVPFDLLAATYIQAVADRRPPGAVCRAKFGLSEKQWEHRRQHMSVYRWLPAGDPVRDGRMTGIYDDAWIEHAQELVRRKLADRAEVLRARAAAEEDRALARASREHMARLRREVRQARQARRAPAEPAQTLFL